MAKTVGTVVKTARTKAGITRAQVAKRMKVAESYISFIERDRPVWLSERVANGLAKFFKVTINDKLVAQHNTKAKRYLKKRA